jgi:N-hydroxyarylamine O-acetyltransferase
MNEEEVTLYLERIGAKRPTRPDAAALAELQERHLLTIPFENLSIHLGQAIVLDEEALFDKVVRRRRGGFCYELNGAFSALLRALGYEVAMLSARVHGERGRLGPPFDHMALRVEAEAPWLVDVGFGRFSTRPLPWRMGEAERDREGTFRLIEASAGDIDVDLDGALQYRIEARPRALADFEPTCWWHQTSPKSHFTQSLVCTRLTERGRITLSGRKLLETVDHAKGERMLADDAEVLRAYELHFGIVLDRVPALTGAGN